MEQIVKNLTIIFQRLREAGLMLNANKCDLFQLKTIFVGHVISVYGVECDPAKVEAVQSWLPPTSVHQVRSFLGSRLF